MKPRYSLVIILLVALLVYGNTVKHGFVWDDLLFIEEKSPIHQLENIPFFFKTNIARGTNMPHAVPYYRPLHMTSMALQYSLWEKNPAGYHLVNLVLNIALAMLVYLFARQFALSEWGCLAAGLLYIVHPVHAEAVAYLGGNSELQYSLFYLAALISYLRFRGASGSTWLAASLLLYVCSLLTKESAITLPLLLLVLEAVAPCGPLSRIAGRISLFAAATLLYLAVRFQYVKEVSWLDTPFIDRLYTSFGIVARYILNLLAPFNLKVLYDIPLQLSLFQWEVFLPFLFLLALFLVLVFSVRRSRRVFLFGSLVLLPILPASGLPAILLPSAMADRYLTLPLAGYALLVGVFFETLQMRRAAVLSASAPANRSVKGLLYLAPVIFSLVFLLFGALTVQRNLLWKDHETLVTRMVADSPGHFLGHELLGTYLGTKGKYDAMSKSYYLSEQVSLERNLALGREYLMQWRADEAVALFEKLMEKFANDPRVLNGMGEALMMKGRPFEALAIFRQGALICPSCKEITANLRKAEKSGSWQNEFSF